MTKSKSPRKKEPKPYPLRETYKGREIVIKSPEESRELGVKTAEEGEVLLVEIDKRPIEVLQQGPQEFFSIYLPYKTYPSPLDLAKDVIDYVPSFKSKTGS